VSYDTLTHSRHNAGDRSAEVGHEISINHSHSRLQCLRRVFHRTHEMPSISLNVRRLRSLSAITIADPGMRGIPRSKKIPQY